MKSKQDIDEAMDALEQQQGHDKARDIAASALNWVLSDDDSVEHLLWELGMGPQPPR
ncbi:hypothetical protein ACLGIH_20355 [Streptomyces sp. HMX87]|uniref:hypothetical protein n=1 Tax=Streptomyces sp. HMX87 TaxID=3390849 RepID=UPI003A87A5DD